MQIRKAYGVPRKLRGRGQTMAFCLWNYSPFLQTDLDAASALAGSCQGMLYCNIKT